MKLKNLLIAIMFPVAIAFSACDRSAVSSHSSSSTSASPAVHTNSAIADLNQRLKTLKESAGGDVGVAILHVETGRVFDLDGSKKLPLYSVFKLPLAVAVLKDVEEKRLQLDRKVHVTPQDVAPGSQFNADLWRRPIDKTVAELIELSIVRSDNTSSDKLLELVGGPAGVTSRMRSMGFADIDVVVTTREFAANRHKPNTGTASDLVRLLAKLKKGEVLQPANSEMIFGFMTSSKIGERRLRGKLPAGTLVGDKTGTGENTTNDVGMITLPEGRGHLALAVFINNSKLASTAQEDVIADIARAAYDAFVSVPAETR